VKSSRATTPQNTSCPRLLAARAPRSAAAMDPSHDPLPAVARICSAGEGDQPILPAGHVCVPLMRGGVGRGPRPYGRGVAAPRTQGIEKVPSGSAETLMPGQQQQAASQQSSDFSEHARPRSSLCRGPRGISQAAGSYYTNNRSAIRMLQSHQPAVSR
jgi:hypothetical protein